MARLPFPLAVEPLAELELAVSSRPDGADLLAEFHSLAEPPAA